MIELKKLSIDKPYEIFKHKYNLSLIAKQNHIEAICISSYSKELNEVSSRFVNLKMIYDKEFIFFSNYNSLKASDFANHKQITALIFWDSINIQIRMKAFIKKTSRDFNANYFKKRNKKKNALAISSFQSQQIESYKDVKRNYLKILNTENLEECPEFWGGFSFTPYYFEFWEGHKTRLNKRDVYENKNGQWIHSILQP